MTPEDKTRLIVGVTVGGLVVLIALVIVSVHCYKRKKSIERSKQLEMRLIGMGRLFRKAYS